MTSAGAVALDVVLGAVAVSVVSAVARSVYVTWVGTTPRLAPAPMPPAPTKARRICGVINAGTQQPCVLADGHHEDERAEHEHATAWLDDDDPRREVRHRWNANDVVGREEKRYRPEYLPTFTPEGERRS